MSIVASLSLTAFNVAGAQGFSDTNGHWAQNTIEWGQAQGYVSGYPDGTFKPDRNVSEAEILTMLLASMNAPVEGSTDRNWADPFYNFAIKMNYPTAGATDLNQRSNKITRAQMAEIVTSTQGVNYSGEDAIKYLLVHGLAHGKTSSTVEGFGGSDLLTRAESISLIKNVKEVGTKEAMQRPQAPSNIESLEKDYQQYLQKQQATTPQTQTATQTDLTLDQLKDLEMQYAKSLSFDQGALTGTPPVMDNRYEWHTVFSLHDKNDKRIVLDWNKHFTEGEKFSLPVNWDDISTGIFKIEILDKQKNDVRITTLKYYETNQIDQRVNY